MSRDSRFSGLGTEITRLAVRVLSRTGLGIEVQVWAVLESVTKPETRNAKSHNQYVVKA